MNRRTIFIILGAVLFALLVGLVWFWFFRNVSAPPTGTGSFGTGTERPSTGTGGSTSQNNIPSGVLPAGGSSVTSGTGGGVAVGGTSGGSTIIGGSTGGISDVPGVDWVGGDDGLAGGGPTTNLVPRGINQLNTSSVGGTPTILPNPAGTNPNGNSFLGTALLGAGLGTALCTAGLLGTAGTASGVGTVGSVAALQTAVAAPGVPSADVGLRQQNVIIGGTLGVNTALKSSDTFRDNFLNCIARTIARAAIQQITSSIVNWINSGFNGQPSFVRNFEQFVTNVADQAAGEYIRGSALSFLCSPFQNQIRTAIAQSYARRNNAGSCTLSGVIKNINAFTNGTFSQGGWGGLLSFTGNPTNNPFGGYTQGVLGLGQAQSNATADANRRVSPGGFLASTQKLNCKPVLMANGSYQQKCDTVIQTPGSVIESTLSTTLGTNLRSLELAKNFDEIISALITQLMTRTLYSGLSNLSGTQGYAANFLTPEQQAAQNNAQALLTDMQGRVTIAQQYGSVQQGSIADIQNAQQQLLSLANCWELASSSPSLNSTQRETAKRNAESAFATIAFYDHQIDRYNANITRANQSIATLQDLQTQAIGVTSPADVAAVTAAYQAAAATGSLLSQTDVTNAQQDRSTLQSSLALRNQNTQVELQQCYAFD